MDAWSAAIVAADPEVSGGFAEPDRMLVGENGPFPRDRFLEAVRNGRITHLANASDPPLQGPGEDIAVR